MKKLPHDPRFDFVDYRHTNLHVTFARERRRLGAIEQQRKDAIEKVTPINQRNKEKK